MESKGEREEEGEVQGQGQYREKNTEQGLNWQPVVPQLLRIPPEGQAPKTLNSENKAHKNIANKEIFLNFLVRIHLAIHIGAQLMLTQSCLKNGQRM